MKDAYVLGKGDINKVISELEDRLTHDDGPEADGAKKALFQLRDELSIPRELNRPNKAPLFNNDKP